MQILLEHQTEYGPGRILNILLSDCEARMIFPLGNCTRTSVVNPYGVLPCLSDHR